MGAGRAESGEAEKKLEAGVRKKFTVGMSNHSGGLFFILQKKIAGHPGSQRASD